jgi:hypothetical protein
MMIKLLEELAYQANLAEVIDDFVLARDEWQPYVEHFAELIVRECADIAKTAAPYSSDDLILKRFGVE